MLNSLYSTAIRTHVGHVRERNEDAVDLTTIDFGIGGTGLLMIVADGMGGVAGGATASTLTVQVITEAVGTLPETLRNADNEWQRRLSGWLRGAAIEANRAVRQLAVDQPTLKGMGTTLLLGVVLDGWLGLAWVGDSRAYLLRSDTLVQLTRDHTWEGDREIEGRGDDPSVVDSPYRGLLTSAIGQKAELDLGIRWEPLATGDLLLLSTDGLTRYYDGEALASILAAASASRMDPEALADQLVAMANLAGGVDNTSVGLIRVGEIPVRRLPSPLAATQSQVPHRAWQAAVVPAAEAVEVVPPAVRPRRRVGQAVALGAGSMLFLAIGLAGFGMYVGEQGSLSVAPSAGYPGPLMASAASPAGVGAPVLPAPPVADGLADRMREADSEAETTRSSEPDRGPVGGSRGADPLRGAVGATGSQDRSNIRPRTAAQQPPPRGAASSRALAPGAALAAGTTGARAVVDSTGTGVSAQPAGSGMAGAGAPLASAAGSDSTRLGSSETGGNATGAVTDDGGYLGDMAAAIRGFQQGIEAVGKKAAGVVRWVKRPFGRRENPPAEKADTTARPPAGRPPSDRSADSPGRIAPPPTSWFPEWRLEP